ncbi:MAG: hypothetical protein J5486_09695 [Bacteroidaceae bacterium]|nr:hypothetical protein [Bacteroidaceae bacterium]
MRQALIFTLTLFSNIALFAQPQTSGPIYCEGTSYSLDLNNIVWNTDDIENLTQGYARIKAAEANKPIASWIDRISNMPDYLMDFYNTYKDATAEVLRGGSNWTCDPTMGVYNDNYDSYRYIVRTVTNTIGFSFPQNAAKDVIAQYARQAASDACSPYSEEYNTFIYYLCLSICYDFPEVFWVRNHYNWGNHYSYSYNYYPSSGYGSLTYKLELYFDLKSDTFDRRIEDFSTPAQLSAAITEFNSRVEEIISACPKDSRYSQVVYLNDWLTTHNCYNPIYGTVAESSLSNIIRSPLSALRGLNDKNAPVCEGYARAFKVLCDRIGIPCMLATGMATSSRFRNGESHMWNEVMMEDGKWYAVDVTWNDPIIVGGNTSKVSGYECHDWLLLGSKDVVGDGLIFEESHPNTITWQGAKQYTSQWDFVSGSLITDYHYNVANAIGDIQISTDSLPVHVYTIDGKYVGTFNSKQTLRSRVNPGQLLIVNGKKMLIP